MLTRFSIRYSSWLNAPFTAQVLLASALLVLVIGAAWNLHADDEMPEDEPTPKRIKKIVPAERTVQDGEMPEDVQTPKRMKRVRRTERIIFPDEEPEDNPSPKIKKIAHQERIAPADEEPETDEMINTPDSRLPAHVVGNGFGNMGRVSALIGPTFGRNSSITPLEFFPYILTDQNFFFADMRGFVTNNSKAGGNVGLGYRRLFDDANAWAGASIWYDSDQSTGKLFQQVGLSFEGLIQQYEFRSNVYIPVTSSQNINNAIVNPTIVGNQLLYTRIVQQGTAIGGFDLEAVYSMPVRDVHIVRGFVGGYFFQGGSVNEVRGVRLRAEAVINNAVTAQVMYTHDNLFGDNVMVGLSMQFPFGKNHPNTGWVRNTPSPFRFVERNYNVIVDRKDAVDVNQVATDPTTNLPYLVEQVNSSAVGPTPDGTAANPYSTVAAAQAAGGNIILVQNGSVLTAPITLTSDQYLFGQGNYHAGVPTTGGGVVQMPPLAQSVTQVTPIIQNVTGNAITLASNTQVAGFNIVSPTGDGITGSGVSNVSLHDLTFSSVGGNAIHLTNPSGTLTLGNIQVASATGDGILISGGNPDLVFNGGGNTITASGNGFVLQNLTGGSVSLNSLALTNTGGSGLVINTVAANVSVNSLSVSQSGATGSAVSITGNTGTTQVINGNTEHFYNTYSFGGTTQITSPNGTGFSVSNSDAIINVSNMTASSTASNPTVSLTNTTNPITIGGLTVNNTNAEGLYANTVSSLSIGSGSFTTVNAPAMDVESSGFNATLGFVNVNGGPFGIKLVGDTGSLVIPGSGAAGSGGTIQNTTTAGLLINGYGSTSLQYMNFTNNAVGIQSTGSTSLAMNLLNMTGSTGYAIDSMNDKTFTLTNSTLSGNGSGGGAGTIRIQANALANYTTTFQKDNITDNNGTAIQMLTQAGANGSSQTLNFNTNYVQGYNNNSKLIDVNWNGPVNSLFQSNNITLYGSGMTAISLQDPTTSATLTGQFLSNTIYFDAPNATNGTAIYVANGQNGMVTTGTSTLTLTSNTVHFNQTGGIGMRFNLYNTTSSLFNMNVITDYAGGATGMLFDNVGPNSTMQFLDNVITLLAGDPLTHRGIIFTSVDPTLSLVTPSGSLSNWVYNTTTVANGFSIPSGTATGGIIIDGTYIVAP